jgi:uncharacterized protein YggT (Ycf19 family)
MDDNTRQVLRSEETVVAGEPAKTTVSQTSTSTNAATGVPVAPVAQQAATVQTTSARTGPSDRVVAHNVSERVIDPAADKAAAVGWVNKLIWFIVGLMAALLAIRFILLLAGADPNAGFAQLIYGLTGWMVAPFNGLFGVNQTFDGSAVAGRFAPEVLVAIVVYILIGFLVTKIADLMLGTNRTTGTIVSDTERQTKL